MTNTTKRLKPVYGFGHYSEGTYKARELGKLTKEYILWVGVLERCYSERSKAIQPSYLGCTMSDNFLCFQYFAEWCQNQVGFNNKNFQLDKDILIKGNKVYSEDTCSFVPKELNILFTKRKALRGNCVIGVLRNSRGKFIARHTVGGEKKYLGVFDTELLAFNSYKFAKEDYIKQSANKFKTEISHKVFTALMNYVVEITD